MSSETERIIRGYSQEAWVARRQDLAVHLKAFADGCREALRSNRSFDEIILNKRKLEVFKEMQICYPKARLDSNGRTGVNGYMRFELGGE